MDNVQVVCTAAENVNLSFYQNAIPIIRELSVLNATGSDLRDVSVHLSSEPPFITPGVWRIDRIANDDTHHLKTVDLKLDQTFLSGLTASRRAEILLRVMSSDEELADRKVEVNLLPPSHWGGSAAAPELLAAFVRPTDPSIDVILREAADKLSKAGRNPAIDGYKAGKRARAWELAGAIWAALVGHSIAYVLPPKSFERQGQMVRRPADILSHKVGTCLDLALLYASCIEQAGLNPLVVLIEGHAFAGLWLIDEEYSIPVVDDAQTLRKRLQLQEMLFVETTMLTGDHPARFKQAVDTAAKHLDEDAPKSLEFAVDVHRARKAQIRPLDLGGSSASPIAPNVQAATPHELEAAPVFEEEQAAQPSREERALTRLESWKNSLLDLSLRNRLLNFKDGKSLSIECPDPARLVDQLSAGARMKVFGRASVLDGSDGRDPALIIERQNEDGRRAYLAEALARNELYTQTPEKDTEAHLTHLFRTARLSFEEGGANVLFLCLGFLKWQPQDGVGPYRAPLVLVPVQLERKSVRSGFRLALHEDEIRFNPTLLQMLRRDFELRVPELDDDLPANGSGVDIGKIWKIMRENVKGVRGFEVTDQVVLTTLSFSKYLLWKDLVDRTDQLKENPVVKHLIDTPTHSYGAGNDDFVNPSTLDYAVDPSDLFTPLSADSSQVSAIVAVQRGKDYVLFGPPGTGKSQTIVNMITNCLAHARTVLFVSQKTAALEVVRRRMEQVGLGDYCLEVHSTKAQKSVVIEQLAKAWSTRKAATEQDWAKATGDLKAKRDELNRLVAALHRKRPNGMTAYEAFGRVVADRGSLPVVHFFWPAETVHAPEDLAAMRDACNALKNALAAIGDPIQHPLRGIEQTKWTPAWAKEFQDLAAKLKDALCDLVRTGDAFASLLGFPSGFYDHADIPRLANYGDLLTCAEAPDGVLFLGPGSGDRARSLRARAAVARRIADKTPDLGVQYDLKAVSRLDLPTLHSDWRDASASNFLVRAGRQKKVRLSLQPCCPDPVPQDIGRDLVILQDLLDLLAEAERLRPSFTGIERLFDTVGADPAATENVIAWAGQMDSAIKNFGARLDNAPQILDQTVVLLSDYADFVGPNGEAARGLAELHESLRDALAGAAALARSMNLASTDDLLGFTPGGIDDLTKAIDRWTANLVKSPQWTRWRAAASDARRYGIESLVAAIEAGDVQGPQILPTFEYAYAKWIADEIVNSDETLSSFLAEHHEAAIEAFSAADDRVAELSKQIVLARIGGGVPGTTSFGSDPEWGILAREAAKKARHLPLRQLFGKIPNVLTRLTPCVMMSPLSIAQYLPPDSKLFDVVIFDEASQIPVWDAIGAMARGRQVIVVGDPEQLPPTSVGQRGDTEDDDSAIIQSQQSILDECVACNLPRVRLTWHYRSKHESLIAFSNARYYRSQLVTFPSPVTQDTALRFIPVKDGVYERGKGRINRPEATAVVAEVVNRLRSSRDSIGIVTFNAEQQKLIEDLLDQERAADPSLDRYWQKGEYPEPVFVKNLENVQGDEREVIIFSCAVGADATGRVTAQISSLNNEGGHRRLNVAITRARREMIVFSSMNPEQIDLGRSNSRGIVDFKHFLEFAKNGPRAIAEAFAPTGRDTESPFEDAVKRALESKNWVVHPQIGVSYFRVDFGIVHPGKPGVYLAGVEADGAQFHRSATARDRDKLRQAALENLGWRILRIWSTEWWLDSTAALEKVHQRLVAILEQDSSTATSLVHDEAVDDALEPPEFLSVEAPSPLDDHHHTEGIHAVEAAIAEPLAAPREREPDCVYADAILNPIPAPIEPAQTSTDSYDEANPAEAGIPEQSRFYDAAYRPVLRKMVDYVVTIEGPLYFDLLVDRISRAHGFQRARGTIREIIQSALGRGRFPQTEDDGQEMIWPAGANTNVLCPWRGAGPRHHHQIPLIELASLANAFAEVEYDDETIVRAMQEALRIGRLKAPTRERLQRAVEIARKCKAGDQIGPSQVGHRQRPETGA
jgi:very-short-patch-repair endonuclease